MNSETNPVVLLSSDTWHIVEHSRESYVAWCGKMITDRRAHSRLNTIGSENLCPTCLSLFSHAQQDWQS
jgi:hypothetical protein